MNLFNGIECVTSLNAETKPVQSRGTAMLQKYFSKRKTISHDNPVSIS